MENDFVIELTTTYLQTRNFDGVTSLYLMPEGFSHEQKKKEKKIIKRALDFLSNEFGAIENLQINNEDILWFEFMVTVGDMEFLQKHEDYFQRVYNVSFSSVGSGFIILQITKKGDNPRLRGVGFALPANPQNAIVVQRIAEKLTNPN